MKPTDQSEKLRAWNTIKQTDQQLAQLMLDINQLTGKPAFIEVVINDKVVLKQGSEQGVRDMTVPKSRGSW